MTQYDYLGQPVLTSMLCFQRDVDSFFNPTELGHTGFAFDGLSYTNGVAGTTKASWSTESQGDARGPLQSFPTQALVIVSRAVLSLIDATTPALNLWSLSYLADVYGFTDNPQQHAQGYLPSAVTWNNGLLTVTMSPDVGSSNLSPNVITFDFVQDAIYADSHQAA
jgi:hypothetical protein